MEKDLVEEYHDKDVVVAEKNVEKEGFVHYGKVINVTDETCVLDSGHKGKICIDLDNIKSIREIRFKDRNY